MTNFVNQENKKIDKNIVFNVIENDKWVILDYNKIFKNKKVIIFGLPGAFTPTCSSSHLPRYEELYETFKANSIDEIYCLSVNDTFVMNAWAKEQGISKIKMLPDGNLDFTKMVGMEADKNNLGFGKRSWRYSMIINDGNIEKHFIEPEKDGDPFEVSDADTMLKYINEKQIIPKSITIFTKEGCKYCKEAKEILNSKQLNYNEICLPDAERQKVLRGMVKQDRPTVPQIFIDGEYVGGLEELKKTI